MVRELEDELSCGFTWEASTGAHTWYVRCTQFAGHTERHVSGTYWVAVEHEHLVPHKWIFGKESNGD